MADNLVRLQVETTCNTSDKALLDNLRAAAAGRLTLLAPGPLVNRPLYICGSGPSLSQNIAGIPPTADVMALNGAYRVLLDAGRIPEYFAMLDARAVNVNFIELWNDKTTALLATQVHPDVRRLLRSKGAGVIDFHLNTPTTKVVFPKEKLYLGGGGTIGLTAIAVGAMLGYRNIVLLGFDSSLADGKQHARPQPQNANDKTLDVWVEDRKYVSTPAMAQQCMDFFPWNTALRQVFPDLILDVIGDGLFYDYVVTNNRPATRETEAGKYAHMYDEAEYRMPAHRLAGIRDLIASISGTSLLDVGTGRGETMQAARDSGYRHVRGTETVDALLGPEVEKALLPVLPFDNEQFDVVTCFEVIEHLLPDDVIPALLELERVAKDRVIFSVATRSDIRSGVELHPSWKPEPVWDALLAALWGAKVRKVGNLSSCGLSPAYEYVK